MKPDQQEKFLGLLLLIDHVTITIPGGREGLGPGIIEELLQDFLPAEFAKNVFVQFGPIAAQELFDARKRDICGNLSRPVKRRVQNLLRGRRWLLKNTGKAGPPGILQNRNGKIQPTNVRKNKGIFQKGRGLVQGGRIRKFSEEHGGIKFGQILQRPSGAQHHIVHHRRHGTAFENGIAGQFRIIIGPRGTLPGFNVIMLVLEGMGQFVGHNHALIGEGAPVGDVEFLGFGIVESLDLLGQNFHHERIEVEVLRQEAESFRAAFVSVALRRVFFFVHLTNEVGTNFFAGTQRFLQGAEKGEACDLAHLAEDFIGGRGEIGV